MFSSLIEIQHATLMFAISALAAIQVFALFQLLVMLVRMGLAFYPPEQEWCFRWALRVDRINTLALKMSILWFLVAMAAMAVTL